MERGDLISVVCTWGVIPYRHYGIVIGDGGVVHLATVAGSSCMQVQRVPWEVFSDGKPVRVERCSDALPPDETVERAVALVGTEGYHLALGNCEHFARGCKTGKSASHQADRLISSVLRTTLAGALSFSGRAASVAAVGGIPQSLLGRAMGISSFVGEAARQGVYAASRHCSLEHRDADRLGKTAGTFAAAIAGTVTGGPAAGAASAALYLSIDQMSQRVFKRWVTVATPAEGPVPYRKSSD